MKRKLLAILMSLAMAFTMMPMMGQTVYATEHPSINLVDENGKVDGISSFQLSNYISAITCRAAMKRKAKVM